MSRNPYDPQNAPEYYERTLGTVTDAEGYEWLWVENQDGERYLVDPDEEYNRY